MNLKNCLQKTCTTLIIMIACITFLIVFMGVYGEFKNLKIKKNIITIAELPITQTFGADVITIKSITYHNNYLITQYNIKNNSGEKIDLNKTSLFVGDPNGVIAYSYDGYKIKKQLSDSEYEVWEVCSIFAKQKNDNTIDIKYSFETARNSKIEYFDKIVQVNKTSENEIKINKNIKIDNTIFHFNNLINFEFGSILDFTLTTDNNESDLAEYNIELVNNNKIRECTILPGLGFNDTTKKLDEVKKLRGDIPENAIRVRFSGAEVLDQNLENYKLFLVNKKTNEKYLIYTKE
ncbi:MAG: hypothetical protein ACRCYE_07630 [Sarcina sp.]